MELSGKHTFDMPRETVYRIMTDPDVLRRTIPGCQTLEKQEDGSFSVTLSIGIAMIRGLYTGTVQVLNEKPPVSYSLRLEAEGSIGAVKGQGNFLLEPSGDKTEVRYIGKVFISGRLAILGQRVLGAGADVVIGQFFRALDREVANQE